MDGRFCNFFFRNPFLIPQHRDARSVGIILRSPSDNLPEKSVLTLIVETPDLAYHMGVIVDKRGR